jgi:hypothetical protein
MAEELTLEERCKSLWESTWKSVEDEFDRLGSFTNTVLDDSLLLSIRECVNSQTKTYRYVLPTQLIAKYSDPSIDARCVQVQRGGKGAFDARSIAQNVIVPFDRTHYNVLGGSPEPYVNNPLRVPEISLDEKILAQQKDKRGWRNLFLVLNEVENHNQIEFTSAVLRQVQIEIAIRLTRTLFEYPTPRRLSLDKTLEILSRFLSTPSGGDRAQAIATALFQTIGSRFHLFSEVRRSKTNAADTGTGQVADIECLDQDGSVVLAVEVKDVNLVINHITDRLGRMRAQNVAELIFLVREGIMHDHRSKVKELVEREFTSGQNIYIFDLLEFAKALLALLGERGRRDFLVSIGGILDRYASSLILQRNVAQLEAK